ncbi:CD209 antigen [Striga asiatica]|uniref:CD209 antigen n=1 Tax=Striga asiatica TaxID=4170 RepID=A0A5A7PUG5_STRAF|nr:CD209 antigen [Striga asiatica]
MSPQFDNLTYLAKNKDMTGKLRLRIHGSAPGSLAQKFKKFNLLEGCVYGITSWELKEDKDAFKLTESSHKFEFGVNTNMYKLDISIVDDTDIVQLLCWDKQDDGPNLPIEIELLTYKAIMFKISKKNDQIGPYNGPFTVARITADPIFLNRFGPLANPSQESKAEEVYSPIRAVKAEEVYSPIRVVKAEVYNPIRVVKAEEVYSPITAVNAEVYNPIMVVKAEVYSPISVVKGCKEETKKIEQTELFGDGSSCSEEPMGKKKIKLEEI